MGVLSAKHLNFRKQHFFIDLNLTLKSARDTLLGACHKERRAGAALGGAKIAAGTGVSQKLKAIVI